MRMPMRMPIRKQHYRNVFLGGWLAALCALLAACGVTTTAGTSVEGTSTIVTPTGVASGTPSRLPTATTATGAKPGGVRVVLDKTAYAPGDPVTVTIENGLSVQIEVTDHHTNCTFVELEQQQSGTWQLIGACKLMTATRLVELPAGSITPQKIGIPTGPNAPGTYRVLLRYGAVGDTQGGVAYSPTFTVT